MITIDQESLQNKRIPIDIEKHTDQFKTENGIYIFPSPALELLEKNIFYLLKNSKKTIFETQYTMRPDYLSYDEYKTTSLAQLLMYVNGVASVEDFDLNEVIIPDFSYIVKMVAEAYPNRDVDDLVEVAW